MSEKHFSSSLVFIFASAAAAIGLGNIWRFPYLAGQNGGGAFVLIYLFFVIFLGFPLMTSEVMLGRIGRYNPVKSLARVAGELKRSRHWRMLGGLTVLAGFLILTYYVVIAGWVLDYFFHSVTGQLKHVSEAAAIADFKALQGNPWRMLLTDTVVVAASMLLISLGVKKGLERTVMILFPALVVLMILLLGYAMTTGHFQQGLHFLFQPDFHKVTARVVLIALGQAFFSLNIAMGVIIMFAAYLPEDVPIMKSVVAVVFADTMIAILAGMIIFPVVFANHLQPSAGPSLIFKTLPLAFSHIPFGGFIGALFFLLLFFAAFTSAIALLEPAVAWLVENHHRTRNQAVLIAGITCWVLSLGTIISFSHPSSISLFHFTFFKIVDFSTSAIMLPLGGLFIAIFTGWLMPPDFIKQKLGWQTDHFWFKAWRFIKRYLAPVAITLILLSSIGIF